MVFSRIFLVALGVSMWAGAGILLADEPVSPTPTVATTAIASQPDPSGIRTGKASDITVLRTGQPTFIELANQVGRNKISINLVWTLLTGYLVMFMSAGFAMVETGFTRAKNAAHTVAMNLLIYPVCVIGFYL